MNTELVPVTRLLVNRRGYRHHGICSGHGRVIHYAGRSRHPLGCIEEISIQEFAGKRPLYLGIAPDMLRGCDIVQRARWRLGERHYDLLSNNCEHLCSWCELGEPRSPQNKSLLHALAGETSHRYRLLEMTRVYASMKLTENGEAQLVAERHAAYLARFGAGVDHAVPAADECASPPNLTHTFTTLNPDCPSECLAPQGKVNDLSLM